MAHMHTLIALGMILAASPAAAGTVHGPDPAMGAPEGTAETLYCMRVEPVTGSRIETVECWTRAKWAQNEVDVDKEWAKEGVAIIADGVRWPARG